MLKHIQKVLIEFAPLSPQSRSVRNLVGVMNTDKNRLQNPKCDFKVIASDTVKKPSVHIVYNDKKAITMDPTYLTCQELVADIARHSRALQLAEDIKQAA